MVRGLLVCLTLVSLASAQPPTAATLQGCALGTAIYRNGDDNRDSCLVMQCNNGDWEYTGEIRDECGNCTVWGDPHFWVFDDTKSLHYGHEYEFEGVGTFAITQPGFDYYPSFGVNADLQISNSQHAANGSCIQNITYHEPGIKVELVVQHNITTPKVGIKVFVNDIKVTIGDGTVSAFFGMDGTVLVFNHTDIEESCISVVGSQGISVSLCIIEDNFVWLNVLAMPILKKVPSQLYGLCNTYTGTLQDHLTFRQPPNGTTTTEEDYPTTDKYYYFVNSWRVPPM